MSGNYPAGVTDNDPHFSLPSVEDELDVETWIFTFGFGHAHPETGESLANCFVEIEGDIDSTREVMEAHFGNKWAFQYPTRQQAGVEKFKLKEIVL